MKIARLAIAVLACVAPLAAQSTPSLDDIIAGYVKTLGGMDRIRAVQSLRRTGKIISGGGFEAVFRQENKRPNRVREETTFQGLTAVTAYNGKAGWKIQPWEGSRDPVSLGEDELKSILEDAEFEDPLIDYGTKGNNAELLGTDDIEGTRVYKIKATLASNGDVRTYYMEADSYVPIRIDVKRTVRGDEREFQL